MDSDEQAQQMLHYALDHGLYYFDTAWAYDNTIGLPLGKKKSPRHIISEERMGPVVKARRKEIFLSTKVTSRDPDEAMRQIETSLNRLQTDHLDQLMIHDVTTMDDVERLSEKGNLIDILHRLRDEGLTRFIGFSGHSDAVAMTAMVDRGDFNTMLIAMNHWNAKNNPQKRQEMAVILMKVVRPRETVAGLDPRDLIKYALSLKGPDVIVLGLDSIEVIDSNLEILRNFEQMDEVRMKEMAMRLSPFYNNNELPWMQPGYHDGLWT
jgi:predicted aldo/keto reductase-like oxidoreductase